jgi:decaprenylphospho-beta-D-erythro-pentofuranosid-2-ulose 2-reductase
VIDAVGNVRRVLLLGGSSDIGLAIVERLAGDRPLDVVLAGRPSERLDAAGQRLRRGGGSVSVVPFDAEDFPSLRPAVDEAFSHGDVDVAVVAFGVLGDPEQAWQDVDAARRMVEVNYTSAVVCGVLLARQLGAQGYGAIVVLSSVAGERPRRSNFVYGSTKAGIDAFYTGLREALRPRGVRVLVVRPGFVRTRMTEGLAPAPLAVAADDVARLAVSALRRGRDVVWAPPALRVVMSALRHLPAPVFRRLPI